MILINRAKLMAEIVLSLLLSFALSKAQHTIVVLVGELEYFLKFSVAPILEKGQPGSFEFRPADFVVVIVVHPGYISLKVISVGSGISAFINAPGFILINLLVIIEVIRMPLLVDCTAGPVLARVNLLDAMFKLPVVNGAVFISVAEFKA